MIPSYVVFTLPMLPWDFLTVAGFLPGFKANARKISCTGAFHYRIGCKSGTTGIRQRVQKFIPEPLEDFKLKYNKNNDLNES
jgi:hypothetical protein